MKKNITLILISITLIISGCGGGGGGSSSANVQSTVIDNFNMTQGTADTKLGSTYIQEFLTSQGSSTSLSTMYSRIDLDGLSDAHSSGWTGKGKTITVLDGTYNTGDHGRYVSDIARMVAPGASRNEFNSNTALSDSSTNLSTMASDIITTSVGYAPSTVASNGTLESNLNNFVSSLESSDALVTVAAQHSNWSGTRTDGSTSRTGNGGFSTCSNTGTMTIATCNTWSVTDDLNSDNVIYVGEVDSNDEIPFWSNQAGGEHKNQFIVTSSDHITLASDGEPNGNSLAAPRVAGAGALVRQKFPNLTGAQTAIVILHTADDLGVSGVDDVFGHGKLNVGKALSPVGNLH